MRIDKKSLIAISILALLTFGCQLQSLAFSPTATPTVTVTVPTRTPTPSPTASFTPTPTPLVIQTLCLDVETANLERNSTGDIGSLLQRLLGPDGMDVSISTDSCTTKLDIQVSFDAGSADYKDTSTGVSQTCYTGVSADGEMKATLADGTILTYPIKTHIAPPGGTITFCPKTKDDANLTETWLNPILDGLVDLFGPEILAHALFVDLRGSYGFPVTAAYLKPEAYTRLVNLHSDALPAVPIILDYLTYKYGKTIPSDWDPGNADLDAFNAYWILRTATGQDFGYDIDAWKTWWAGQSE
jgi:hypothetical protein